MPSSTVSIVEYRPTWSAEFDLIASQVRDALGDEALQVDHIGSTAVPALAAKDIIDVQVTVRSLDESIAQRLLAAGFSAHTHLVKQDHVPPGFEAQERDWSKFFFMQKPGARRSNIHVRQIGKPNQRYPLLVRDFLRAEPRIAAAYAELKRRLAKALSDADTYPDVKDPVADIIYLAAERWAVATSWQPQHPTVLREASQVSRAKD
jgi:GrpB-like predicted nucleotidyltransferase (UPF0157 family)